MPGYRPHMPVTLIQDRQGFAFSVADTMAQTGLMPRISPALANIPPQTQALIILAGLCPMDDMSQTSQFVQTVHHALTQLTDQPGPVLLVIDMGGGLGLRPFAPTQSPLGGLIGLVQRLASSWQHRTIKLLDLHQPTHEDVSHLLINELQFGGHAQCVAFDGQQRRHQLQYQPMPDHQPHPKLTTRDVLVVVGQLTPQWAATLEQSNATFAIASPTPPKNSAHRWYNTPPTVDGTFDALMAIRKDHGHISGIVLLPSDGQDQRLATLSLLLAATLSDTLRYIFLIHHHTNDHNDHITQMALHTFAQAEQRQRHAQSLVKSITCPPNTPPALVWETLFSPSGIVHIQIEYTD